MKKTLALIAGSALVAVTFLTTAAGYWGDPSTPVNSNSGSTTNIVQNMQWPKWASNASFTNVTKFALSGTDAALQFTVNLTKTNDVAVTNVIWHLGRSVKGGMAITNALATGVDIEWFATFTNAVAASATSDTRCYLLTSATGTGAGAGALDALYVGWVDVPAGTTITNYYVAAKSR